MYGLSGIEKLILDIGNVNNLYVWLRLGWFGYYWVIFYCIIWLLIIGFLWFWNSKRMENFNLGLEMCMRGLLDCVENV